MGYYRAEILSARVGLMGITSLWMHYSSTQQLQKH